MDGFGYTEVNLIYVEDSYGKAYKDSLLKYFEKNGLTLNVFPHRRTDKASIIVSRATVQNETFGSRVDLVKRFC